MNALSPEARRFIERGMIARIVTTSPKGRPQIMPLWFYIEDGDLLMSNARTSPTVHNLIANPEVEVLMLARDPRSDRRCLRIRGTAIYDTEIELTRRQLFRWARKYHLSAGGIASALRHWRRLPAMRRYYSERNDVGMIRVTPASAEFIAMPPA